MATDTLGEVGSGLGLLHRPDKDVVFGLKDGFGVHLAQGKDGNHPVIRCFFHHGTPGDEAMVNKALKQSRELVETGIKPKHLEVKAGRVAVSFPTGLFGLPKPGVILQRIEAMLLALKPLCAALPLQCRLCNTAAVPDVILVDGVLDRVCESCLEQYRLSLKEAEAAYDSKPFNFALAVPATAITAMLGAFLYGWLIVLTERMFWFVAICNGLAIGFVAHKLGGKGGLIAQVLAGGMTVLSVVCGLLGVVGYNTHRQAVQEGMEIDWFEFIKVSPGILVELGPDAVFSLVGGLVGAWYALKKAAKPKFSTQIQR